PVGISSVKVAVWQAADQRDLRWITLDRQADGTFTFADFVEYHMRFFGPYTFHAYATLGNGVQTCIATAQADVMPYNYVVADRLSSSRCRVSVYNPNGGDATVVMFPTWAQAKGRECTAWYQGINNGDGSFSTIIDARNHNASGTFYTDVQVSSTDGSTRVVKSVAYELSSIPPALEEMSAKAQGYHSATGSLILVNTRINKVAVFGGYAGNWSTVQYWDCTSGAPETPTVVGEFTVGSRGYYFDSGASRCFWWTQFYGDYLFHSVLYYPDGTLMDGRLGMALSHGCVRLAIDNAKWIYDTIPSGTKVVVY
ncbi:MAG: GBS Bsp-like repeat-containing protein, partial [Raoultibacter sp.]